MKKSYILTYSEEFGTREEVKKTLSMPEISHWRFDIEHCFYLVSESPATILAEKLQAANKKAGRFFITEISPNKQGWLSPGSWHLINNKEYQPKTD